MQILFILYFNLFILINIIYDLRIYNEGNILFFHTMMSAITISDSINCLNVLSSINLINNMELKFTHKELCCWGYSRRRNYLDWSFSFGEKWWNQDCVEEILNFSIVGKVYFPFLLKSWKRKMKQILQA